MKAWRTKQMNAESMNNEQEGCTLVTVKSWCLDCRFRSSNGRQLCSLTWQVLLCIALGKMCFLTDASERNHQSKALLQQWPAGVYKQTVTWLTVKTTEKRKWWKGGKCTEIVDGSAAALDGQEVLWVQKTLWVCMAPLGIRRDKGGVQTKWRAPSKISFWSVALFHNYVTITFCQPGP